MKKLTPLIVSACLTIAFSIAAMDVAFSQNDGTDSYVTGITPGRAKSLVGGAAGLISLIIGWLAKRRSAVGAGSARTLAITGLLLGSIGVFLSVMHLAGTTGSFGTGGGKAGAIVGLVLATVGIILSGLALRPYTK